MQDCSKKNEELRILAMNKSLKLEDMLWQVKNECEIKNKMVNDNERLDQIIQELEHRNRELSAMLL